jgi:spermidine synthase
MTGTNARTAVEAAPPVIAIALISAAALAFEIVLMRLFSITLWHHFAYMIISLALLGYGASGALLTLAQSAVQQRFAPLFCAAAAAFGVSAIGSFVLAQRVPFNPLEILWDPRQPAYLLAVYLLLALPFLCAGSCVCMAFSRWRGIVSRIYSFDILGAGAGSLAAIGLLFVLSAQDALRLIGASGFAAAAVAWLECGGPRRWPAAALMVIAGTPFLLPESWVAPAMSPYKGLSQMLQIPQARVVEERSSPLGLVSVVESPGTPLRYAPGLSLNATAEPPPQLGVFIDGEGMGALTRFDGRRESLAHLGQMTSALPYHLLRQPRVLVLGAGAGADVLQAQYHGARQIDAVELNPQVVDLVRRQFAAYAGGIYSDGDSGMPPTVRVHVAEARGFVAASEQRYDLIHVALLDSFSASSAGLYALAENYLYTVQAVQDDLRHLEPGGLLAITRWVTLPPRDALKLFAAAVAALEHSGVADPASRLALVRSWQTSTLLVKNGAFSSEDIAAIKAFCIERSFDVAFYPGMKPHEANRYNVVAPPDLFDGATALLGPGRNEFLQSYKFHIAAATDDKPHFFHFFRWRSLTELLSLKDQGGLPLLEWGYPVLVATLAQALVASLLLIAAPAAWVTWAATRRRASVLGSRRRVLVYFAAIGLAFMFIEIAFIQKFVLFLSQPLYAVAVVLFAFLLFAGIGSAASKRWHDGSASVLRHTELAVVAAIALSAALCLSLLPWLFQNAVTLPDSLRIVISAALIAPLAFFMGMPFPMGLARVEAGDTRLIPWAWATNGCASVTGAVLATLLAIHIGFTAVVVAALVLYAVAAMARP